jgi:UPF0271 protein
MVRERAVVSVDGATVPLEADTLCVHGDTPGAAGLARAIRAALELSGITVEALGTRRKV